MTERKLETDVFPFASKGFDSAQAKLLRNMFDRLRIFARTTSLSGTGQVEIPELSFNAKGGKSYKFTVRGRGSFLGNMSDVELSFDYDASTDMTAVSRGFLFADNNLDGTVNNTIIASSASDPTVTFAGTIDGEVSFEWSGILAVPSSQKVVPYINIPAEQSFTYLELELFELS